MYIEQAYKTKGSYWKYLPFPLAFIGLMAWNFYEIQTQDINVEEQMKFLVELFGKNGFLAITLMQFVIGLAFLLLIVKFVHKQSIVSLTTSRKKIDWKRVGFSALLWSVITVVVTLIEYWLSPESFVFQFNLKAFIPLFMISVLMIPLQTSFEEYLFRGYMMQGLGVLFKNRWVPFLVTSLLFGLMHIGNPEVEKMGYAILIYYISTGFFLGLITLMDEGLELALGFHAANNTVAALLVTSSWTAFQTDSVLLDVSTPSFGAELLLPLLIVYPIVLYIFAEKYHWTHWKKRLFSPIIPKEKIEL
jgi:membrane protease YdiL (CAAX protease family)